MNPDLLLHVTEKLFVSSQQPWIHMQVYVREFQISNFKNQHYSCFPFTKKSNLIKPCSLALLLYSFLFIHLPLLLQFSPSQTRPDQTTTILNHHEPEPARAAATETTTQRRSLLLRHLSQLHAILSQSHCYSSHYLLRSFSTRYATHHGLSAICSPTYISSSNLQCCHHHCPLFFLFLFFIFHLSELHSMASPCTPAISIPADKWPRHCCRSSPYPF